MQDGYLFVVFCKSLHVRHWQVQGQLLSDKEICPQKEYFE
jgi:hypothetical protein